MKYSILLVAAVALAALNLSAAFKPRAPNTDYDYYTFA